VTDPAPKQPAFAGHLIHLSILEKILPEQTSLSLADMQEIGKGRIAQKMGEFLTKHFFRVDGKADGSIELGVSLTLLVSKVPEGVAHTTIVFREVPKGTPP
jgi:hypothetical protein